MTNRGAIAGLVSVVLVLVGGGYVLRAKLAARREVDDVRLRRSVLLERINTHRLLTMAKRARCERRLAEPLWEVACREAELPPAFFVLLEQTENQNAARALTAIRDANALLDAEEAKTRDPGE